jgi:energy-coupling factor transport system substrate-specific component
VKEIFTMWRHTQMVVLVALSAAIYAAFLIVTQGFVIIPGFTNLRPGNVFPFVFGVLFGPAGAWGAAIGNLINDFFGTLGLGSIAGFVGNFFLASCRTSCGGRSSGGARTWSPTSGPPKSSSSTSR